MANLANRYRPSTWEDVTEQKLVVDMLKSMCDDPNFNTRNFLLIGPAGCGKANTLDTEILTPDGFIKMGDIQIGQSVFTHSGSIGKVSGVFPQGKRDIYRITLQDKTHIDVSDEHINVVYRYNEDKKQREDFQVTTSELIELFETTRFKLRIDTPSVDWEYSDVPINPYLLGCLLGDGGLSNNFQFSGIEEDIIDSVDTILRRDWNCKLTPITSSDCDYDIVSCDELHYKYEFHFEGLRFNGCKKFQDFLVSRGYPKFDASTLIRLGTSGNCKHVLKDHPELSNVSCVINPEYVSWNSGLAIKNELSILNLMNKRSDEKHIPKCYLYNSREVRLKLLQGLFDTDGTIDKSGSTEFTTSSKQLSDDFEFLVRSLGCRDTVSCSRSSYTDADGNKHSGRLQYYHYIKFPSDLQFYSSCKHKERFKIRQNEPIRNIVSIEYRGREECQCIMVDHPDHTYICGNGFIPTHNTTLARIMGNYVNEGKGEPIEIDAASNNGIDAVRNIIDQARSYPVGQNWKVFILDEVHAFSNQAWQALLKTLESGAGKTLFFMATTNPEKIPATILSRVQTFQLSKISLQGIHDRLCYVLESEKSKGQPITYTDDAVNFVAKMANGGMRDSLTLLDKCLAFSNDITIENVTQALNLPEYDDFFELLSAYAKKNNVKITEIVDRVYNSGVNFVKWFENFHSFVINIVKYIYLQDISKTMIPSTYQDKISKYGNPHLVVCLKLANKLMKMNHELKSTQYLQEVALTNLCFVPAPAKKG